MQPNYAAAQQPAYFPQRYAEQPMQQDNAAAQEQPYIKEDARPLLSMRDIADAQAAVQAAVATRRPAPPAAPVPLPAAAAAPAAAAQPTDEDDPHVILKDLQASMGPAPAASPPAAPSPAPRRAAPAADTGTSDADGFDWMRLAPKAAGGYESDPAMRALSREAESLDDVYDPSEDPGNVGPGPSKKGRAAAGAYWTRGSDDLGDAWWEHGGEDGMT